jgi:hypothetical protein
MRTWPGTLCNQPVHAECWRTTSAAADACAIAFWLQCVRTYETAGQHQTATPTDRHVPCCTAPAAFKQGPHHSRRCCCYSCCKTTTIYAGWLSTCSANLWPNHKVAEHICSQSALLVLIFAAEQPLPSQICPVGPAAALFVLVFAAEQPLLFLL